MSAHCCDLYLDETGAHCVLPACTPHQEVLSGPSLCLPSAQEINKERTRPLRRGCWYEGTPYLCRRDSSCQTTSSLSTARGMGTAWTRRSYAQTSRLSSVCSRTRIGRTPLLQNFQQPAHIALGHRLLGWPEFRWQEILRGSRSSGSTRE